MQASVEEKLNPDQDLYSETKKDLYSETKISRDFYTHLKLMENSQDDDVKEEENEAIDSLGDDEEDEEEEFSFMCGGENTSSVAAEDAFVNGQIKPVFPLFNRDLLFSGDDSNFLHENLPMRPPVKKVFVEMNEENDQETPSTPENDEIAGPYCEWSNRKAVEASPEVCNKSNSTGFSKIWRLKEFTCRCNSDGRDAFVFLKNSHAPPSTTKQPVAAKVEEKGEKKESTVKVINRKVRKSDKTKTASLSAHEVYLKSKAKEEERRRSYLPYRPELMGFFTNVNSGLTKNVHPF